MSDPVTEASKATGELAKLGQKSLETIQKAGRFFEKYFGNSIPNIAGISEDWTAYWRARNFVKIMQKVEPIRSSSSNDTLGAIPERQAIPLVDAMSQESDESLQELWARYVAKGLTDQGRGSISRVLTSVLRQLEPDDVKTILFIQGNKFGQWSSALICQPLGLSQEEMEASLTRMCHLGLLAFTPDAGGAQGLTTSRKREPAPSFSIQTSIGSLHSAPLLFELLRALKP